MEYDVEKREIRIDKVLNVIDRFVIDFVSILERHTKYVIVSGYVAILLGRSRSTEDIDLLIPDMDFQSFKKLFNKFVEMGYECANTSLYEEAYDMWGAFAIRFFKKGYPIPNIEFKKIKTDLDKYSFENRIRVIIGDIILYISPLELQIAYKLFLAKEGSDEEISSDKDIEDAKHLYKNFREKLNKFEFDLFIDKLDAHKKLKWLE